MSLDQIVHPTPLSFFAFVYILLALVIKFNFEKNIKFTIIAKVIKKCGHKIEIL